MKASKFTKEVILAARKFWEGLTPLELVGFWRHYTTGKGAGMYANVGPKTGFFDYLVLSARETAFEMAHDI
jgi:hypothetical protein